MSFEETENLKKLLFGCFGPLCPLVSAENLKRIQGLVQITAFLQLLKGSKMGKSLRAGAGGV